jgi:hypothetical protein
VGSATIVDPEAEMSKGKLRRHRYS